MRERITLASDFGRKQALAEKQEPPLTQPQDLPSFEVSTGWKGELSFEDLKFRFERVRNLHARGKMEGGMFEDILRFLDPMGEMIVIKGSPDGESVDIRQIMGNVNPEEVLERLRKKRFSSGRADGRYKHFTSTVNEKIIEFMLEQKGRMVTREELIVAGWNARLSAISTYTKNLDVAVCLLRKDLKSLRFPFDIYASKYFSNGYYRYYALLPDQLLLDGQSLEVLYPGLGKLLETAPLDDPTKKLARKLANFEVKPSQGEDAFDTSSLLPRTSIEELSFLIAFLISEDHEVLAQDLRIFTSNDSGFRDENWRKKVKRRVYCLRDKIRKLGLPFRIESTFRDEHGQVESYKLVKN